MADFEKQPLHLKEQDLTGKVAVVTGASRGIGRAIAVNLACRGCSVLGTCSSDASLHLIDTLSQSITKLYEDNPQTSPPLSKPKIYGLAADITASNHATLIADCLEATFNSKLNILINNAAITGGTKIGSTSPDQIHRMLNANLQTPILLVDELVKRKLFLPSSRIVNISSDRARSTSNESVIYSATKAGLESLVRTWAKVLGGNEHEFAFMAGTTANSVSVGATESEVAKRLGRERLEERLKEELPKQWVAPGGKGWFAQVEEVADVVGMLCSREGRWITGSVVPANGGATVIL
ncbi:3-oxoacyl-reductase [Mollisia scopiformis]|uniref:3-oxoacyl-reductase n=1 Tax=Mollisia scopiformis TaxID=149040 RepID=A0A194WT97_MOLSC|nr:3-oxoacyl-reductase [Mollisia scopiformis]KUJ10904.1 3-oxoacyl-reductase [Mollisia scopiformis]